MTIQQIQTKLKYDPAYKFLSENEHLGDNIILLGLGGSHAYGLTTPTSDLDIRGIAINSRKELLLQNDFEQVVNKETDTTIYSFQKMIKLLSNCNPNTIEILGLPRWGYLYISDIGKKLLDNKEIFLSRRAINKFGGYANQQLYRLEQICSHKMPQKELEKHIFRTIKSVHETFPEQYADYGDGTIKLYIDESDREDMDTEIFMDIQLTHYPLRDYCKQWNTLQNITSSYNKLGKRNNNAKEHGKIAKHMTHLIRLNLMCLDILNEGKIITFREKDMKLLWDIRNGKYITEDNQVKPEFYEIVNYYENLLEKAKQTTELPPAPDTEKIHKLVMEIHEEIISKH